MVKVIDSHTHLDHIDDVATCLSEAYDGGVESVVTVGVDLVSNKKNLELKEKFSHPKIYVTLGIHPGNINPQEVETTLTFIKEHLKGIVAIGEIGLDYWYKWVRKDEAKKEEQRTVFRTQLDLAKEADLPVIIHSRGAWNDCLKITRAAGIRKAVFHWYTGPVDVLKEIILDGYFISATPALSYSPPLQEAVDYAPIEQTLIETDSPVFFRDGEKSFPLGPKDVLRTLKGYARRKRLSEEEAARIFYDNTKTFFGL